jgi:hypothetical protein
METPQQQQQSTPPPPQILSVQTSNVTISTTEESVNGIKCTTTSTIVTQSNGDDDYEAEAKNDENKLTNGKYIFVDKDNHSAATINEDDDDDDEEEEEEDDDEEDKENSRIIEQENTSVTMAIIPFHHHTNGSSITSATKLVLEKSSSISLFPDAPTTPKVCRKAIYEDEADLKQIVKKYQTTAVVTAKAACCDNGNVGECLVCHPKLSASKASLEIDKGITSC